MDVSAILLVGLVLGVRHALESDHLATVASLAARATSVRQTVRVATAWGLGHAGALLAAGLVVFALGTALPPGLARAFEGAVGVALVGLGIDVLRRLRAQRVHAHVHQHGDGRRHWHVHAHAGTEGHAHDPAHHEHAHAPALGRRALALGGLHGMAGSAAATLLAIQALPSFGAALLYLALFGLGSVLGMVAFSLAIAVPFRLSPGRLGAGLRRVELALGCTTVALGCWIALEAALARG